MSGGYRALNDEFNSQSIMTIIGPKAKIYQSILILTPVYVGVREREGEINCALVGLL